MSMGVGGPFLLWGYRVLKTPLAALIRAAAVVVESQQFQISLYDYARRRNTNHVALVGVNSSGHVNFLTNHQCLRVHTHILAERKKMSTPKVTVTKFLKELTDVPTGYR